MIEKKLVEKDVEVTVTEKRLVEKEFEVTVTEKRVVELFTYEGVEYTKDDLAEHLMREAKDGVVEHLARVSREADALTEGRRERGDRLCLTLCRDWMHKLHKSNKYFDDICRQLYKILHAKMILIESLDDDRKEYETLDGRTWTASVPADMSFADDYDDTQLREALAERVRMIAQLRAEYGMVCDTENKTIYRDSLLDAQSDK